MLEQLLNLKSGDPRLEGSDHRLAKFLDELGSLMVTDWDIIFSVVYEGHSQCPQFEEGLRKMLSQALREQKAKTEIWSFEGLAFLI